MKFTMKSPSKRMKNPLKAPGNKYEIYNEIPKLNGWKIH
jgi:hypothetical protein